MKVGVMKVEAFEGPAYQYQGEDGYPAAIVVPVVLAKGCDGKLYQLPNEVTVDFDYEGCQVVKLRFSLYKARDLVDKIYEKKMIDVSRWVEVTKEDISAYIKGGYGWAV